MFSCIIWFFLFIVDHNLAKKTFYNEKKNNNLYSYKYFILGNTEFTDSCGLTEQCIQPFSVCFHGTCKCINGFSALNTGNFFKGL